MIHINFINTGLDERICKSIINVPKTYKLVHVPASADHKAYDRMQQVNVEQAKVNKKNTGGQVKYKKKEKKKSPYTAERLFTPFPSVEQYKSYCDSHSYYRGDGKLVEKIPDVSSEAKAYINDNVVKPLMGKTFNCVEDRKVTIQGVRFHFYDRINKRFPEVIEEACQHVVALDLKKSTGWNVYAKPRYYQGQVNSRATYNEREFDKMIDVPPPPEVMAEFHKRTQNLVKHVTKGLSDRMFRLILHTLEHPKFIKKGTNNEPSEDPALQGSTEFVTDEVSVVISHEGYLMTFWPNNLGKRFSYQNGWDGQHPPDVKDFLDKLREDHPDWDYDWERLMKSGTKNPYYYQVSEFQSLVDKWYQEEPEPEPEPEETPEQPPEPEPEQPPAEQEKPEKDKEEKK